MEDNKIITDTQIMRKIKEYDSKALEELYDRYSPILYTLIKKIVPDQTVAEEVLADIFVILWKKGRNFELSNENLYTWLIILARNKAVDRKIRDSKLKEFPEYSDDFEDEIIIPKISKSIDPFELSNVQAEKEKFEEAMNKLTEAQKYVINMAFYDGKTQCEIASELNIPLSTVKSKIQVALSNLKTNFVSGG
ncbi:MAG: sigma-70 family RNA polymerase sigma factor [Ignavibacteria bacterium]|nr:sigma-70 family RNA polymerase sigma factor [Ignavibacteria bacterium]